MSGVLQAEQRLTRLRQLRNKIDREIVELEAEEQRRTAMRRPIGQPRSRSQKADDRVSKHLERLGVSAHEVKVWAVDVGLLDAIRRGRVKADIVDQYEAAHPHQGARA